MARPRIIKSSVPFVGENRERASGVGSALGPGHESVPDKSVDKPRDAGPAQHHSVGEIVHPQPMVLRQVELHQDVEFG